MRRKSPGFTLVEILIVVIILGILAAIVIPQFTSASTDARVSATKASLQTLRGQIELFKIQHADTPPAATAIAAVMAGKTNPTDTTQTNAAGTLGPYVQVFPTNPMNSYSAVTQTAAANFGWVYSVTGGTYTISASDTTGTGVLTY